MAVPELDVAGHRLAVEAEVVGGGAEDDVGELVFLGGDGQFVLVAVDLLPAVGAAVVGVERQLRIVGGGLAGPRLVHPAGLWHADAFERLVPVQDVQ